MGTVSHTPPESQRPADEPVPEHERAAVDGSEAPGAPNGPHGEPGPVTPQLTEKQSKRLKTPVSAMIISMIALLGITLPFVWLQPRPDNQTYRPEVDLVQTAQQASHDAGYPVLFEELAEPWHTNFARWNPASADAVPYWEFGTVTPSGGFLTVTQTDRSDPTWLAEKVDKAPETGSTDLSGVHWQRRAQTDAKSGERSVWLVGTVRQTTVVVGGQATDEEFSTLVAAMLERASGAPSASEDAASGRTGSDTTSPDPAASENSPSAPSTTTTGE